MKRGWFLGASLLAGVAASWPTMPVAAQDSAREDDQTILVTGSRLDRPNDSSPTPIQTVTPVDFVLTGVPNVEQTLNQLPQLVPGFTNTSNNPGTGAATLNLRGLGSVRTLILVNGRRWIASDAGQIPEVDVNTIPAALIERVDIVTGGASAVYGSDAVTGVVNFILNSDLEGLHLAATQNITEQGDGRVSSADLSWGTGFAGDRGHVVVSAGWLDQDPVIAAARPLSSVTLQDFCGVPGTRDETGASTPVSGPCLSPNSVTLTAGGSPTIPGGRIPGNVLVPVPGSAALVPTFPFGVRFDSDGTPEPFDPATDLFNFARDNYLQIGFRRWSGMLLAEFEASPAFEPYVELAAVLTRSPQQLAAVPANIGFGAGTVPFLTVNLDNPLLAPETMRLFEINFGIDADGDRGFVGSPATGFSVNPAFDGDADGLVAITPTFGSRLDLGPRRVHNRREAVRGLVGIRGELGGGWDYDLYVSHSDVEHLVDYDNGGSALRLQQALLARRDPATGDIACIDPSGGCVPANLFGPNNLSREAADFIASDPRDVTTVEEQIAEAVVRGELAFLPAGPAGIAAGLTWRRSAFDFTPDPSLFTGDDLGFLPGIPAAGSTRVRELFGEARVPLLDGLTAELGLRLSDYDSVGTVWTWKALGEWVPFDGLRLRGGIQRAIRAPNARELFEESTPSDLFLLDPCAAEAGLVADPDIRAACLRNGVTLAQQGQLFFETFAFSRFGGDPDLDAETARTLTIGGVLTPPFLPGLSVTLDYYDVRIRDAIGPRGGGGFFIVLGCILGGADPADSLCQAFTRDADGSVVFVDQGTSNLPLLFARGIDWQMDFRRSLGGTLFGRPHRIELRLSGTRYFESGLRPSDNLDRFDCAGLFGFPCGTTIGGSATPEWKLYNSATWTVGPAALTLRHRWFSSTLDSRVAIDRQFGLPPTEKSEEGQRLESRHYLDLAAAFRLSDRFDLTLGVNNLTHAKPAITGSNQVQSNTDPSLYDVLGRRFFVALSVRLF